MSVVTVGELQRRLEAAIAAGRIRDTTPLTVANESYGHFCEGVELWDRQGVLTVCFLDYPVIDKKNEL